MPPSLFSPCFYTCRLLLSSSGGQGAASAKRKSVGGSAAGNPVASATKPVVKHMLYVQKTLENKMVLIKSKYKQVTKKGNRYIFENKGALTVSGILHYVAQFCK